MAHHIKLIAINAAKLVNAIDDRSIANTGARYAPEVLASIRRDFAEQAIEGVWINANGDLEFASGNVFIDPPRFSWWIV